MEMITKPSHPDTPHNDSSSHQIMESYKSSPYQYLEIEITQQEAEVEIRKMQRRERRVNLSEWEINEALRLARQAKAGRIAEAQYLEKVKSINEKPISLTIDQMQAFIIQKAKSKNIDFEIDKDNQRQLNALLRYFSCSPEFEQIDPSFSLKKGICLLGPPGIGKTMIMRLFTDNPNQSFVIASCVEVAERYVTEGKELLSYYSHEITFPANMFRHRSYGVCFDDLGEEPTRKNYGNETNVMQYILGRRYDHVPKHYTHFTSNISADQMEQYYGFRIRDRMRELFNMIVFPPNTPSRRR